MERAFDLCINNSTIDVVEVSPDASNAQVPEQENRAANTLLRQHTAAYGLRGSPRVPLSEDYWASGPLAETGSFGERPAMRSAFVPIGSVVSHAQQQASVLPHFIDPRNPTNGHRLRIGSLVRDALDAWSS